MPAASLTTALRRLLLRAAGVGQFPSGTARGPAQTRAPWDRLGRTYPAAAASAHRRPASCPSGAEHALTAALQGPATRAGGLWIPPAEHRIGPQTLHSDSRHPLNPGSIARPRPYDRLTAHTGADHGRPRRRTTRTSMPSYPLIHKQISPLPRTPSPFAAASVTLLLHCQGGSKTDRRFGSLSDRDVDIVIDLQMLVDTDAYHTLEENLSKMRFERSENDRGQKLSWRQTRTERYTGDTRTADRRVTRAARYSRSPLNDFGAQRPHSAIVFDLSNASSKLTRRQPVLPRSGEARAACSFTVQRLPGGSSVSNARVRTIYLISEPARCRLR